MNIGVQMQTKTGNIYIADVINKKIKLISSSGKETKWKVYENISDGRVGSTALITFPEGKGKPVKTTEIVKIEFPKIGD